MNAILTCSLLAAVAAVVVPASAQVQAEPAGNLAHTSEHFDFTVSAPYADVFPLFGAHEEPKWAKGFEPKFLYPVPAHDQPRMVFHTVQEGQSRVWMNTAFDSSTGHVQYVYWIADVMVALIDIHVIKSGAHETKVDVVYERTALRPEANDQILQMAHADAHAGPHWAEMINGYFANIGSR